MSGDSKGDAKGDLKGDSQALCRLLSAVPVPIVRSITSWLSAKDRVPFVRGCRRLRELTSHPAAWPPHVALDLDPRRVTLDHLSYLRPLSVTIRLPYHESMGYQCLKLGQHVSCCSF
jgi:hypothetical protein